MPAGSMGRGTCHASMPRRLAMEERVAETAMSELAVFTGNAHPQLARDICRHLGVPLGQAQVFQFPNENIFVKIDENVRGKDVFVVQSFSSPVNTSIMEVFIMIDALRRAKRLNEEYILAANILIDLDEDILVAELEHFGLAQRQL